MMPWQQRVLDERAQLIDRLEKLYAALPTMQNKVSVEEHQRLRLQSHLMTGYLIVLDQRIAAWP